VTFIHYKLDDFWYRTECRFEFPVPPADPRWAAFYAYDGAIRLDDSAEIMQNPSLDRVGPKPAWYFMKSFQIVVYVNVYM
jgi:hypothetical protein